MPRPGERRRTGNLFLAWDLTTCAPLEAVAATLPPGVRRVAAADRHATAFFLGPVAEETARTALELLREQPPPRWSGALDRAACFGPPRRPSALGLLASRRTGPLAAWREVVTPLLAPLAARPPDRRPFLLHVTLGRPPRRADPDLLRAARAWCRRTRVAPVPVALDRLALYGPAPRGAGRRYVVLDVLKTGSR